MAPAVARRVPAKTGAIAAIPGRIRPCLEIRCPVSNAACGAKARSAWADQNSASLEPDGGLAAGCCGPSAGRLGLRPDALAEPDLTGVAYVRHMPVARRAP